MRSIILCVSFFLSSLASAQTQVILSADLPASCERESENHQNLNWIYNLQKIRENEETVGIRFTTAYGSCIGGKRVKKHLDARKQMIVVFQKKVVLFQERPFKVSISNVSSHEAEVQILFDKKRIFKKSSEKSFDLNFVPGEYVTLLNPVDGKYYFTKLVFSWDLKLLQAPDLSTDVAFGSIRIP